MAPNSNKLESEPVLQAIVLADSFNERFRPITIDKPRCLLPLCNVPLIEYTLESLVISGVEEIFVFCCAHSDQIKEYIKNSKYSKPHSPVTIKTIVSQELYSVGDALRDLDAKGLITNDFILVSGDVVSNIRLDKALEVHRARRAQDKNAIMTMVLKKGSARHRTRALDEAATFVIDSKTHECVYYESLKAYPQKKRVTMELRELNIFENHPEIEFRNDLIDCQIDICSVEVLALFTENFDYQKMREHFVHGIVTSDLLGKTIYCHIVDDVYAARVSNTRLYDSVSKDIMSRWTYPLVPDSNLQEGDDYEHLRGNIYKQRDVVLSRSCKLGDKVIIGRETHVGENAQVRDSVIGRGCRIGPNVILDGAYLWDGVVVGAGSTVRNSILADGVRLEESVHVEDGCLIAYNVVVGPNVTLPPFTKLTRHKHVSETDEDESDRDVAADEEDDTFHYDTSIVGEKGAGYLYTDPTPDEDEMDDDLAEDSRNLDAGRLGGSLAALSLAENDDEDSDSDASDSSDDEANRDEDFTREVIGTLDRAFNENHTVDNTALEINTLRMAFNTTFHDLREIVIPWVSKRVDFGADLDRSVRAVLKRWGSLIGKVAQDEEDQVDALLILQHHCAENSLPVKFFLLAMKNLYELEVLDEDSILAWYYSETSKSGSAAERQLRDKAIVFIKWLEEAEEEDDDDEEDDE
ncbi:uncharacterized protein VTP21DRAFT_4140 [Calcarisporiella thermophila]|uniref:uncharacterized protein n=1 Tax=Calcarisporiella thermophila TaxID=911321 RepID=UPI0037440985